MRCTSELLRRYIFEIDIWTYIFVFYCKFTMLYHLTLRLLLGHSTAECGASPRGSFAVQNVIFFFLFSQLKSTDPKIKYYVLFFEHRIEGQ